jgi:hypothetical protein
MAWAAGMPAGSPVAQPVTDQFAAGAQVLTNQNCALLQVRFNVRVRYAGHFPQTSSDDLKITLQVIDRGLESEAADLPPIRHEGINIDNPDFPEIRSATLDRDLSGLILRVRFAQPAVYQVTQFGDFSTLSVIVQKPGSTQNCQVSDFSTLAPDAGRSGRATAPEGGLKVTPKAMKLIDASMDEARAALKQNKYPEAIALLEKVLTYAENKASEEALELLGEAHQKAGQLAEAKSAYEAYLHR